MASKHPLNDVDSRAIERDLGQIEGWYGELQQSLDVCEQADIIGSELLDRKAAAQQPVHSWYILKEAFSHSLPIWATQKIALQFGSTITSALDPFVGCGTTGLSLATAGINTEGVEYNPFICFVASTKADACKVDYSLANRFSKHLKQHVPQQTRMQWPELSTFHKSTYFRPSDIRYLLYVLREIDEKVSCNYTKNVLRLGVARSIEPISNLQKDGRALRYIKKNSRPTASEILPEIWSRMLSDIASSECQSGKFGVHLGSAKNLHCLPNDGTEQYDLVLYSPPYLNNFDYSEIYKLELWLLGFITNYDEWHALRQSTIRSHHSIKFPSSNELGSNIRTKKISEWLEFMAHSACLTGYAAKNMPAVIQGYFDDMYLTLKEQFRVLKPGGYLVFVVANSKHALLPVATDIILAHIAQEIGFDPLEVTILKMRNGRTKRQNFLRESAVFMRKPRHI